MDKLYCSCGKTGRYSQIVHGDFIFTCGKHGCESTAGGYTVTGGTMPLIQRVADDYIAELKKERDQYRAALQEIKDKFEDKHSLHKSDCFAYQVVVKALGE